MLRGLDVSSVQGAVAWDAVSKQLGCRFAWVKCSEGNRGKDPIVETPSMFVDAERASGVTGRDPRFTENVASYPLVPHWPVDGDAPVSLHPWTKWMFWQFTGGKMMMPNGVPGDFQVCNGDEGALAALCRATTT